MTEEQYTTLLARLDAILARLTPQTPTITRVETEGWLQALQTDPTYRGIDVQREFGKAQQWCAVRKKSLTKRRFVNWLNNCEPVSMTGPAMKAAPAPLPEGVPPPPEVVEVLDRLKESFR